MFGSTFRCQPEIDLLSRSRLWVSREINIYYLVFVLTREWTAKERRGQICWPRLPRPSLLLGLAHGEDVRQDDDERSFTWIAGEMLLERSRTQNIRVVDIIKKSCWSSWNERQHYRCQTLLLEKLSC